MRNIRRIFVIIILLIPVANSQTMRNDSIPKYSYGTVQELWNELDALFNDPNFANAHWGVSIQSLTTGEYFYRRNDNKLFMPASNLKLFTTAAALLLLGPDYKFETEIFSRGKVDGSILIGDLIIRGNGDPAISGRFYGDDMLKIFNDWADSLLEKGIDEIKGNIIGDDNLFDDQGLGEGWAWDYESDWFAAPSSPLTFNDNCVDIFIQPTMVGQKAEIKQMPDVKYTIIDNQIATVPKDSVQRINYYRERGTNIIKLSGTIKEESEAAKIYVTVNNPTQFFVVTLKEIFKQKGITITGTAVDIDDLTEPIDYAKCELLLAHHSPPLTDIIKIINKNSQNLFSENLIKAIGYEINNYGTFENGIKAAKEIFAQMGINPENILMYDGSGLSRLNLISPMQVNVILNHMYKSELYQHFYNSLPIAGIDGSLSNRMRKTRAQNNIRAKTGYIGHVRSLSGYLFTGDREPVAFSIIANNFNVPLVAADNLQDLICIRLANFKRK